MDACFQQPDSVLELVNFKCGTFGVAIILTSEVPGTEVSRTWRVLKDDTGVCVQRAASWTLIHHLPLGSAKQAGGIQPKPQARVPWLPFSAPIWPPFLVWISVHLEIFLSPSCPLCTGFLPHLSPDGWALYPQHSVSFLRSLKLLLLTDLSLGTLVPDHLCALPGKVLGWTHCQLMWPYDFLSRAVMRWHTCAIFQASLELL